MNSPAKKSDSRASVMAHESSGKTPPDVPAPYSADRRLLDFAWAGTDWFWEKDSALRFCWFSDQFEEVAGVSPNLLLGHSRRQMLEQGDPVTDEVTSLADWWNHVAQLEAHEPFRDFIHPRMHPRKGKVYVSISGTPVFDADGQFAGYRGSGRDATREIMTEKQLMEAKEEAEQANLAKTAFLANMSHELRTPLNAIIGFSEMITHFVNKPERNQEYANYISTSGRHLLTVINEVLDYSKIEAGKMELTREDVRFADIVHEIHPLIEFQLKTAGLTLRQEVPQNLRINVDPQALRQMLVNLLSNAIKFSPGGREILLSVRLQPDVCEIAVIDRGVGIPSAQLDAVMMPFQQARNDYVATGETGTGLGLAIVDNLMRLHGGTVRIESEEGFGTTVRLLFPADIVVPQSSGQPTLTVVASRT